MGVRGERRGPERRGSFIDSYTRVLLIALPLAAIFISVSIEANLRDGLRIFVLSQAAVVVLLYAQALWNVLMRVAHPGSDRSTNEIRRGHLCQILAIFVLLSEEIVRVVHRIGEGMLNWRTPLLQLALLLLFFAWLWLERRSWRTDDSVLEPTPKAALRDRARRRAQEPRT
jgi:hypothetical protein